MPWSAVGSSRREAIQSGSSDLPMMLARFYAATETQPMQHCNELHPAVGLLRLN
ncbi:hypothetical protein ZHAS_00017607 [Anopheles sinensis]|uniref:Uncharacterized protein n=1 Tax=Anopheles sinensis TaxID=74873 RepID=A0A084WHA0_ANOSI|nr:hypothetical protein ZHAS_00017607 [Anopheles sinensis]